MSIKAAILVVAVVLALVAEQSQGLKICNVDEFKLMKCVPAVTKPNPKPPMSACCEAISGADMKCMCTYKSSPVFPMLGIDPALCLGLPPMCGLPKPAC
ncbi:hypothetical protein V2J09_022056 [Rumex salicifolius]